MQVEVRIEFKMLVLAHNAYIRIDPKYLKELVTKKKKSDNFQFVDDFLLNILKSKKIRCGDRTFEKAAPLLWNGLPEFSYVL